MFKLYSFLLDKSRLRVRVRMDDQIVDVPVRRGEALPERRPDDGPLNGSVTDEAETVPLINLAWGRSGDKGNQCNVGLIARTPELVDVLRRELSAERVKKYLSHLVKGEVTRFEVPGFNAFNFLLDRALDGGGMASLRNDPWGKGMAQILLRMPVQVPKRLIPSNTGEPI